jgi:hypothetical protein
MKFPGSITLGEFRDRRPSPPRTPELVFYCG